MAIVTERHSMMAGGKRAGLEKRILHAGRLLPHGNQRLAKLHRTHTPRTQIADLFDLQQIKKGVGFGGREHVGLFPGDQLPRAHPQDSN